MMTEAKPRIFQKWAGNPEGVPEDKTRCAQYIWGDDSTPGGRQCFFRRGHGPDGEWCKLHAKRIERRQW